MLEIEKTINLAVTKILHYLKDNSQSHTKVIDYKSPELLSEKLTLNLPDNGVPLKDLIPTIEAYLEHSVRTSSHKFFNQLWGGFEATGLLAQMVTSAANTSMYTYEVAPVATLMEKKLIEALNQLVGFSQGEGLMVTGGSNANLIAMLCGRHHCLPEAKMNGLANHTLVAFCSDQSHYSLLKAANLLGIGMENLIKVPSDNQGRMNPQHLELAIQQSLAEGKKPFFVGATAGTTVQGAFDPLKPISQISRQYGLWLHVDGAWGAPVLFSRQHRHLLEGSELADSFTWDAHKLMGIPLICSAILLQRRGTLLAACSSGDTNYLFHDDEHSNYDLGTMSVQCGRTVDALKLWLAWQHHGTKGYEARVDRLFELANYAASRIQQCEHLKLMTQPVFLNLCFRYHPTNLHLDSATLDRLNLEIRNQLMLSGEALVNYAHYQDQIVIRLILTNPELQKSDLDHFFDCFIQCGENLLKSNYL